MDANDNCESKPYLSLKEKFDSRRNLNLIVENFLLFLSSLI